MKPTKTWIVITDGARSRILLNLGPGKGIEEVPETDLRAPHPKSRDILTDRPGRTFSSADSTRHAYETKSDPKRKSKEIFSKDLAEFLNSALVDKKFDQLIIAGDPKSLGAIRGVLTKAVEAKLIGDLAKDLTQIPNSEIASHFDQLIML